MDSKERLQKLNEQLKERQNYLSKWHEEDGELRVEAQGLIASVIIENKILNMATWQFTDGKSWDKFTLLAQDKGDKMAKELEKIWPHNYHDYIHIAEGVKLRYDDGDLRIIFDDTVNAYKFIKEHDLKVDITHLYNDVIKLKEEAEKKSTFLKKVSGELDEQKIVALSNVDEEKIKDNILKYPSNYANMYSERFRRSNSFIAVHAKANNWTEEQLNDAMLAWSVARYNSLERELQALKMQKLAES